MSIIIHGGGITGSILALALSRCTKRDFKISLIEKNSPYFYNEKFSFDVSPKVIALSKDSYSYLSSINIDSILASCSTEIKHIEISEYKKLNKVFINAQNHRLTALGYVIELDILRKKIFDILYMEKNVNIYCPATIKRLQRNRDVNIVWLDNGKKISSKLIVASDGAPSMLATSCGIKWFHQDYHQIAVVFKVVTNVANENKAFERFLPYGSLAILPMSQTLNYVIWCIPYQKKCEMVHWNKLQFIQELQKVFGWRLGKILNVGPRYYYHLKLIQASNHISHRLVLVGNSAQCLHPIAGQGLNLCLRDIFILVEIIKYALSYHIDIGEYSILYMYQKNRLLDQKKIIKMTDGLVKLFKKNFFLFIMMRDLGLFSISYSIFLQSLLIYLGSYWKKYYF